MSQVVGENAVSCSIEVNPSKITLDPDSDNFSKFNLFFLLRYILGKIFMKIRSVPVVFT